MSLYERRADDWRRTQRSAARRPSHDARRQRNISKAGDATLMKCVQRPFSEVIAVYGFDRRHSYAEKRTNSEDVTCSYKKLLLLQLNVLNLKLT